VTPAIIVMPDRIAITPRLADRKFRKRLERLVSRR
jgi:hypothetical protein